jgi:hypothetical protein
VHEDTDGDGLPDRHRVFIDGLNMANAVLPGRGGVWVMNTPYLLFFPDANGDDVPDGPPVVHLAGFGLEDTHSVANGLVWGPDGWIYGGQGSTTTSRVVRPGLDPEGVPGIHFEGCMVWRYHPVSREYELFSEGSGNVFGLELDGEGRLFSGHNGSETCGWHYQQGGYYLKQGADPGKFGPPRNPYIFGQLPWMAPAAPFQRFTHILSVVEGAALPPSRQGQLFWFDPLHNVVLATDRHRIGATFGTRDLGPVLHCSDEAFRPVYLANAPDGSIIIADFYEHYIAHGQHYQSPIDPTKGRLYRLRRADPSDRGGAAEGSGQSVLRRGALPATVRRLPPTVLQGRICGPRPDFLPTRSLGDSSDEHPGPECGDPGGLRLGRGGDAGRADPGGIPDPSGRPADHAAGSRWPGSGFAIGGGAGRASGGAESDAGGVAGRVE